MNDWFTVEKIDRDTYAVSEYGHYEQAHSYLLLGKGQALLIDTGLGIGNIRDAVAGLTDLPVKVATTHAHWDHIGGHGLFEDVSVHEEEAAWLRGAFPLPIDAVRGNLMKEQFTREPPAGFDIGSYSIYSGNPSTFKDADMIDIGSRRVGIIHTPGHSPGHVCFYEEERGYLFAGDLIYLGTLYAFYPSTDPARFRESIDRIHGMGRGIKRILPSHHALDVPLDIIGRIKNALSELEKRNLLKHGGGVFECGDFSIRI